MGSKSEDVAPDWAGIAAAKDAELSRVSAELQGVRVDCQKAQARCEDLSVRLMSAGLALDEIEPQCHRRDVRGAEVVALVRAAMEGGSGG